MLRVGHGGNAAARLVARVFLLPRTGDAVETRLVVTPDTDGERWRRTFGTRALNTRQYPDGPHGFAERIGPLELRFRREASDGGTFFRQIDTAVVMGPLRARLPRWCAPSVVAREDPDGERRVRIDVRVSLPLVGPILSYAGTIKLEEDGALRTSAASEPAERSGPRSGVPASDAVGESEGRSPSDRE
jgi:hypothetical protein